MGSDPQSPFPKFKRLDYRLEQGGEIKDKV